MAPNILNFLKVKSTPILFWSAPKPLTFTPPLISILPLCLGLVLFGLGEAILISSGIGVSPWTVLAEGITHITGWSIGLATFVISLTVLLSWVPLRQVPGIGTILNAIIIAAVIDLVLPYLPQFQSLSLSLISSVIGVMVTGIGGGIYLIANLGPGPRDGLMTGLQRVTNWPIAWVRSGIEVSVVMLGWALGGTVGIGTMLFAFGIGPCVAATMFCLNKCFPNESYP